MTIQRNDDVVFSYTATLLDYAMSGNKIVWLRLQTSSGHVQHILTSLYQDFTTSFSEWEPDKREIRVTFTARVHLPIYKDGALVALTCVNTAGHRFTVRFAHYTDLLFTNLADELERKSA